MHGRCQWLILKGLEHSFVFPEDYILNVIGETQLDLAILQCFGGEVPRGFAEQDRVPAENVWNIPVQRDSPHQSYESKATERDGP